MFLRELNTIQQFLFYMLKIASLDTSSSTVKKNYFALIQLNPSKK